MLGKKGDMTQKDNMASGNEKRAGYVIAVILATVLGMIVGAGGTLFVTRNVWGGKEADKQIAKQEDDSEETGQENVLAEDDGEPAATGIDKGEELGHTWEEATCTEPRTCSVCGETEGEALGHTWIEATCLTPKTCSVCGETEGETQGHTWQEATCRDPKTCTVCGATEGELAEHAFDWDGTCSVCHLRKIELTWDNFYDYFDASCSQSSDGSNYRITVTITPTSNNYSFQDVQIHIGLNLQRSNGGEIELLYDAPLDFNFNDLEHFYDLDKDGCLTIEGHFPKDYELDFYRPLALVPRGFCVGE